MNFSLDGGWMLAIVVLLWLLVYVPNWGSRGEQKFQGSSSGRNFSQKSRLTQKNSALGVSQTKNIDKNFRVIRSVFVTLLLVSFATAVYATVKAFENLSWLALAVAAAAVFLTAASTLRSSRKKATAKAPLTMQELEAQRARMAYSIRESALPDAVAEQLFDERAWTEIALPESNLARRIGELEEVKLATVSNLGSAAAESEAKKLNRDELDRILERRRAV
jgi:hypothetical protein